MEPPERVIPAYGKKWKDEFIGRRDENFSALLEKLRWMHDHLQSDQLHRSGRRNINPWFSYEEELERACVPQQGKSFKEAAAKSLESFEGSIRWHHPDALFNITPSPLLDTVALTALTALYNPNGIWDMTAGKFILTEKKVIRMLAKLAGWDSATSGGLFTNGGKATLQYAVKSGLNQCDRQSVENGLRGDYAVIISDACHFSVESVCNYAGIGRSSCVRVRTGSDGVIDMAALQISIDEQIRRGRKIACVILSGGGTMNLCIDPVQETAEMLEKARVEHGLPYKPHLHLDSVISWAWLFVSPNAHAEKLGVREIVAERLRRAARRIREIKHADSFGADFHKTGLSPYISSCFVSKNRQELVSLNSPVLKQDDDHLFGDVCNFERTIENSRPCMGIVSAYHVIERLGKRGFEEYLAYCVSVGEKFRQLAVDKFREQFEVINTESLGFEVVLKINFNGERRTYNQICFSTKASREVYRKVCEEFFEYICYGEACNSNDTPFIGYVMNYKFGSNPGGLPAFLLYPTSVHIRDEDAFSIMERLLGAVRGFEEAKRRGELRSRKRLKAPPK